MKTDGTVEDKYIGKRAYKEHGYFSYRIGIIEKNDSINPITPYRLRFSDDTLAGISEKDIVLVKE